MKTMSSLFVVFGWLAFSLSVHAATYDATGRWGFTTSSFYNDCEDPHPPSWSETVVLIQSDNNFFLVYAYKTVSGTINGNTYTTEADRYWEDEGYTTETITLTATSPSSASGSSTWTWTDGIDSCSGGYSLDWTRQSQSPAAFDATGTWDVIPTQPWTDCGDGADPTAEIITFNINQNGNIVTANDSQGNNLKGFINGKVYTVSHSFPVSGGITSLVCDVTLSTATQGVGTCWWVADMDNDSSFWCEGGANISITKQAEKKSKVAAWLTLLLLTDAKKKVFVTSALYPGNLGGVTGADQKCNVLAQAAELSGTYMAWVSDETSSPNTRFTRGQFGYMLVEGTMVAKNWDDLTDGTLINGIDLDETGVKVTSTLGVWTGTTEQGTTIEQAEANCNNWTSSDSSDGGIFTSAGASGPGPNDDGWSAMEVSNCQNEYRLFCFEQ